MKRSLLLLLFLSFTPAASAGLIAEFIRTPSTEPQSLNYYPLEFSGAGFQIFITPQDMGVSFFAPPDLVSRINAEVHQHNEIRFIALGYNGADDTSAVPEQPGIYQDQFSTLSLTRRRLVPNLGPGVEGYRITAIEQIITDYAQTLAETVPKPLYRASAKQNRAPVRRRDSAHSG